MARLDEVTAWRIVVLLLLLILCVGMVLNFQRGRDTVTRIDGLVFRVADVQEQYVTLQAYMTETRELRRELLELRALTEETRKLARSKFGR